MVIYDTLGALQLPSVDPITITTVLFIIARFVGGYICISVQPVDIGWPNHDEEASCGLFLYDQLQCLFCVYTKYELGCRMAVTSKWGRWRLKSPASRWLVQLFVKALIKGNIKAPRGGFTGDFPTQRASNAENVSIWWRHHAWHLTVLCHQQPRCWL